MHRKYESRMGMVVPYAIISSTMTLAPALSTLMPFLEASLLHSCFIVLEALTRTGAALRAPMGIRVNVHSHSGV